MGRRYCYGSTFRIATIAIQELDVFSSLGMLGSNFWCGSYYQLRSPAPVSLHSFAEVAGITSDLILTA